MTMTPMGRKAWSDPAKCGPCWQRSRWEGSTSPIDVANAVAHAPQRRGGHGQRLRPAGGRRIHDPSVSMHVIGLDIGTTGVKSILLNEDGALEAEAAAAYPHPQSANQLVRAESRGLVGRRSVTIRQILSSSGARRAKVAGVGLSGQYHGLVLLDKAGRVLRPCILWNDQRTHEEAREVVEKVGGRRTANGPRQQAHGDRLHPRGPVFPLPGCCGCASTMPELTPGGDRCSAQGLHPLSADRRVPTDVSDASTTD